MFPFVILGTRERDDSKERGEKQKKLADYKASLSREEIQDLVEKTKKLQEFPGNAGYRRTA